MLKISPLRKREIQEASRVVSAAMAHPDVNLMALRSVERDRKKYEDTRASVRKSNKHRVPPSEFRNTAYRHYDLSRYIVAKEGGRMVGVSGLYRSVYDPRDVVWLNWTGVLPQKQGNGVGSALVRASEELARKLGMRLLLVSTDTWLNPLPFYKRLGFKVAGRVPGCWSDKYDQVWLYKRLRARDEP